MIYDILEDWEEKADGLTDEGVWRTAPATPGLLKMYTLQREINLAFEQKLHFLVNLTAIKKMKKKKFI